MIRHRSLVQMLLVSALLSACGGGSSTSPAPDNGGQTTSTAVLTTHAVQLGPISGAAVTVYRSDCLTSLYRTTTDNNGSYSIDANQLKAAIGANVPDLLCIISEGGTDLDPNDDGIQQVGEAVSVAGKIKGYVLTTDLLTKSGTRINLFSSAVAELISKTDDVSIARIEQIAQQIGVPDADGDGKITISDVTRYEMGSKPSAEASLREFYLRSIHTNSDSDRRFFVDTTDAGLAAVRASFTASSSGALSLDLQRFNKDAAVYYGFSPTTTLPNLYTRSIPVKAGDVVYTRECLGAYCYPLQAFMVNASGTKLQTFADVGNIDLASYYSGLATLTSLYKNFLSAQAVANEASQALDKTQSTANDLNKQIADLEAANKKIDQDIKDLGG